LSREGVGLFLRDRLLTGPNHEHICPVFVSLVRTEKIKAPYAGAVVDAPAKVRFSTTGNSLLNCKKFHHF
jgi:hypothetical protein